MVPGTVFQALAKSPPGWAWRAKRAGVLGEKSSLFFDMMRLAWQSQAHTIIMENVPNIKSRGLDVVREACEVLGYT